MGSVPAIPSSPAFIPPVSGYAPLAAPMDIPPPQALMPGATSPAPQQTPPAAGLGASMVTTPGRYPSPAFSTPLTMGPGGFQRLPQGIVQHPGMNTAATTAPEIAAALKLLAGIQHLPGDEDYLRSLGVDILYRNGMEAYQTIRNKGIQVVFGDMGDSKAHAQWIRDQNTIMINQKYQGDMSPENLYAISEAIYHEAGHVARLGDDMASIQEELNALALNVLGYRYHTAIDPSFALSASQSRLIQDGVALYARLFFDPDPAKQALVNRMIEKYGTLQASTADHPVPPMPPGGVALTDLVCRQLQSAHIQGWQVYA